MEKKEIEEGNKLIAEFMGLKEPVFNPISNSFLVYLPDCSFNNNEGLIGYAPVKWHTSWDWLMPVVEKIERNGAIIEIWLSIGKGCRITVPKSKEGHWFAGRESNELIEAVWLAVVDFVKWYNSNNQS